MTKKQKAASDGRNIESGRGGQTVLPDVLIPTTHYITGYTTAQGIAALLPEGLENAVSSKALARRCGCTSTRQLQELIARERAQGALILSSAQGGYYLPAAGRKGRIELEAYVRTLHARAVNTIKAAQAARQALKRWEE